MGSVYHRFGQGDLFGSVIYSHPHVEAVSGSTGWRGNMGVSGSLSLYEGIRARRDISSASYLSSGIAVYPLDAIDSHTIDDIVFRSGSYPSTGSINLVKVHRSAIPDTIGAASLINVDNWYDEHFSPIEGLFDYYHRFNSNFFTGSYDYYMLYLKQNSAGRAACVGFFSSSLTTVTSSFTLETQIKPTDVTSSIRDFVIQSQQNRFSFYITGSSGKLAFRDIGTILTSSVAISRGIWQHVAVAAGNGSASFYVDGAKTDTLAYTGSLVSSTASLIVGALQIATSSFDQGFDGFLFDSRVWDIKRTDSEISGSFDSALLDESSVHLVNYARFNDGPLSVLHGFSMGSGAFDYGEAEIHGQFRNINELLPATPIWQPNDNQNFVTDKSAVTDAIDMFKVVHVPSMFYGRQIATGSVRLECRAYDSDGLVRVIRDDGRGGLYVSGSITRTISSEEYSGVRWNKVGNVFYSEGLIVITDPSLLDLGENKNSVSTGSLLTVNFDGVSRVPTRVFMCRLGTAEGNASGNPTYSRLDDMEDDDPTNDRHVLNSEIPVTYVTAVGLYNEDRKLVAVAKLAQPIRKRETDPLAIRLKIDL